MRRRCDSKVNIANPCLFFSAFTYITSHLVSCIVRCPRAMAWAFGRSWRSWERRGETQPIISQERCSHFPSHEYIFSPQFLWTASRISCTGSLHAIRTICGSVETAIVDNRSANPIACLGSDVISYLWCSWEIAFVLSVRSPSWRWVILLNH